MHTELLHPNLIPSPSSTAWGCGGRDWICWLTHNCPLTSEGPLLPLSMAATLSYSSLEEGGDPCSWGGSSACCSCAASASLHTQKWVLQGKTGSCAIGTKPSMPINIGNCVVHTGPSKPRCKNINSSTYSRESRCLPTPWRVSSTYIPVGMGILNPCY